MPVPTLIIDDNGISAPPFADILAGLVDDYQGIYGSDVFLDPSSQDFQWIAVIATAISDCYKACVATFNSFSPTNAQGAGLSSLVKINGLRRQLGRFSSVDITVVGVAETSIVNGLVGDNQNLGSQWLLPSPTLIPSAGQTVVTAICSTEGPVAAAPGTITKILNPQPGWQSVNNPSSAAPGADVETDPALKVRQSNSTGLPAQSPLEALQAAVGNVTGVSRVRVYENDSNIVDANGIPPLNIAPVVEGGNASDIATTIALKKTPGSPTFGTVSTTVVDKRGIPNDINFSPLLLVPLTVVITIKGQTGFATNTGTDIVNAVVDYVNGLDIGEDSFLTRLYSPAYLSGGSAAGTYVVTSVLQGRGGNNPAAADVQTAFNEAFTADSTTVTLVVA